MMASIIIELGLFLFAVFCMAVGGMCGFLVSLELRGTKAEDWNEGYLAGWEDAKESNQVARPAFLRKGGVK